MRSARRRRLAPACELSYRDSHTGAAKARSYDEDLTDPASAKGQDWLLEQMLLTEIVRARAWPVCRAADFACGTGRVLEYLGRLCPDPVGIDISPDMLAIARRRCPGATLICADVTVRPELAPGPFDIVTAFRFFLNAEPSLRAGALDWMRAAVRPGGLVVANFHLNPLSIRGAYLRLHAAEYLPMCTVSQARQLFVAHGFTVLQVIGYSFLPYRRDGRRLFVPRARRAMELRLAGSRPLRQLAGSFLVVAEVSTPRGGR